MIHLLEITAGNVIAPLLPDGWVSVGAAIDVRHLAATPVGFTVTATAKVVEVGASLITFTVEAHDGTDVIGRGTHVRAPVEFARFMKAVERKAAERRSGSS
jgi:predicted thioesterase